MPTSVGLSPAYAERIPPSFTAEARFLTEAANPPVSDVAADELGCRPPAGAAGARGPARVWCAATRAWMRSRG